MSTHSARQLRLLLVAVAAVPLLHVALVRVTDLSFIIVWAAAIALGIAGAIWAFKAGRRLLAVAFVVLGWFGMVAWGTLATLLLGP